LSWRNELLAVWAVTLRNALMGARNVFFFFELLFWPIVGVLSIGLMSRFLELTDAQASFVLVGTIALSIVNVCQLEVAYAVLLDVWSKSLKHQFLAPIGIRHLTLGSWIVGMVRSLAVFVLLAALARWAFGFHVLQPGWLALVTFLLGCFLTAWVVGVAVCALITLSVIGPRRSRGRPSTWCSCSRGSTIRSRCCPTHRDDRPRGPAHVFPRRLPVALRIRVRVPGADRDRAGPVGHLCRARPLGVPRRDPAGAAHRAPLEDVGVTALVDPAPISAILGFLLGLQHATDPDHLVAVATILTRERRFMDGALIGVPSGVPVT
jgi:hypothetical protein